MKPLIPNKNPRPFEEFKEDVIKLIEHAMTHENLYLDNIIKLEYCPSERAIIVGDMIKTQNACGTPCCIMGYSPEVLPDKFHYSEGRFITVSVKSDLLDTEGYGLDTNEFTYILAGGHEDYSALSDLFDPNSDGSMTDHEVSQARLDTVLASNSYEELIENLEVTP